MLRFVYLLAGENTSAMKNQLFGAAQMLRFSGIPEEFQKCPIRKAPPCSQML